MIYSSSSAPVDRRVRRTREVLQQASIEVMQENGFLRTTIQQITDRANVNRGTFYAHYPDKYALLNDVIHTQFQQLLVSELPPFSSWNWGTMHHLIRIVVESFEEEYSQCHPAEIMHPLIVQAIQDVLTNMLFNWLTWESSGTGFPTGTEGNYGTCDELDNRRCSSSLEPGGNWQPFIQADCSGYSLSTHGRNRHLCPAGFSSSRLVF